MKDDEYLRRFENQSLPRDQWNHRAHLKVAYLYLTRGPFDAALGQIRAGIRAYNAAHAIADSLELKTVFSRVGEACQRLIPYDGMGLSLLERGGRVRVHGVAGDACHSATMFPISRFAPTPGCSVCRSKTPIPGSSAPDASR
mgnify:CR=1 FL=1